MATVSATYDVSRDAMVASQFIEDTSSIIRMKMNASGRITILGQFIETASFSNHMRLTNGGNLYARYFIEETQSVASVTPADYPLFAWFKADSLTTFTEGENLGTGSKSWIASNDATLSASIATGFGAPNYTELKLADNAPAVHFLTNQNDILAMNRIFDLTGSTVSILFKGTNVDSMMLGNPSTNIQVRKYRSNANNISTYAGSNDIFSNNLSSSYSQSVVCTWVYAPSTPRTITFYENKYYRGGPTSLGVNGSIPISWIGRTSYGQNATGSFVEICIWSGSFDSGSITNLFDNYWKTKYPNEIFYEA